MRVHGAELNASSARWLAAVAVLAAALAFFVHGYARAHRFPVPLDDTYIHFDFARSAALGHPFEWLPGNGYSSGATSVLYPFLLAPAWLVGFRGDRLAFFAGALAILFTLDFARSLIKLAPRAAWFSALAVVAIPLLDWSLFSGMEVALFVALLGRALVAARRTETSPPHRRAHDQWISGLWLAAMVATRPETVALAAPLALVSAHAARSRSAIASLARAAGPFVVFLALQAIANRTLTGEWSAAGAVRKLLTSNPYSTGAEIAIEVVKNAVVLRARIFGAALEGAAPIALVLATAAIADKRSRRLALSLATGAVFALVLVSFNSTARFQNFRYGAPSLAMLIALASLGVAAIAARTKLVAAIAGLAFVALPLRELGRQIDHFARASGNIAEQQVVVGERLAARAPRRVFLGDAGAIPYFSNAPALDGLGLGGFHGLPFARASVHGVPAVLELIERIDPRDRPDVLAIYPSWWPGLADVFGRRVDAVKIDDNVICGAEEKVIYEADWSALATPGDDAKSGAFDALDVGDLVDEAIHDFRMPSAHSGWMIGAVHEDARGARRFDGGRIVPEGDAIDFRVRSGDDLGPATLAIRTDESGEIEIEVDVDRRGDRTSSVRANLPATKGDRWFSSSVALDSIERGDRLTIRATRGALRVHHLFLARRDERAVVW